MKVLTLLNEKGGVGKTTSAVHIAAGLAIKGQRVLLIDSDPQGHATTRLGMKEFPGLYELLVRDARWEQVLFTVKPERWAGGHEVRGNGQIAILPSNIETRLIPMALGDDITLFKERMEGLGNHFDTVVIDTPPTPSLLHTMIYLATDMIVYPVQCQLLALDGLGKSIRHIEKMNQSRESLGMSAATFGGVLPTMFDGRTGAHQGGMGKLEQTFGGDVLPPLRNLTAWREAEFAKRTIFAYAPGSAAEADMWSVIHTLKIG